MPKRTAAAKPPKSQPKAAPSADVGTLTPYEQLPPATFDGEVIHVGSEAPPKSVDECLGDLHELMAHLEHAPSQAVRGIAQDAQKRVAAIRQSLKA